MFDIGFLEMMLVGVIGLVILGPERLPTAIRTTSLWLRRLRRSFNNIKTEIERELNTEEIKRDLHNDAVMESLREAEKDLRSALPDTSYDIENIINPPQTDTPATASPPVSEPQDTSAENASPRVPAAAGQTEQETATKPPA